MLPTRIALCVSRSLAHPLRSRLANGALLTVSRQLLSPTFRALSTRDVPRFRRDASQSTRPTPVIRRRRVEEEPLEEPDPEAESKRVIFAILGVNTLVFIGWYSAKSLYQEKRDARSLQWMYDNFTSSYRNLREGRVWTLLTCVFSHEQVVHFALNSLAIYWMGPTVCQLLGTRRFLILYMGAGIASSLISMAWNVVLRNRDFGSHGASGATYAILSFYATTFPKSQLLIWGVIPAPAWLCIGGIFVWDLYHALDKNPRSNVDSPGHVGGMLAGLAYALYIMQKLRGR